MATPAENTPLRLVASSAASVGRAEPEPVPVAFLGRTSTLEMQDPRASLSRQIRSARQWLPPGWFITAWYWDIESGGLDLEARGHGQAWRSFAGPDLPQFGPPYATAFCLSSLLAGLLALFLQKLGKAPKHQRSTNLKLLEEDFAELGRIIPVLLLDEAQNCTTEQMLMFLTRLGLNSKAVVTGDPSQVDLPANKHSGLVEAQRILCRIDGIAMVEFHKRDVVRHALVQRIIAAYEEHRGPPKRHERTLGS